MEHVFIINPTAGKEDASAALSDAILAAGRALGIEPVILKTTHPGHAREIAARYAAAGAPARLYACGGDGTLNEVLQEVAGRPHLTLGCVPCGSGNDYVRNFGTAADFLDISAQLQARPVTIDALSTSYGYSVDICAAGLDAQVAYAIPRYRHLPLVGGGLSYTMAIVETLLRRMGHQLRITLDGPDGSAVETGSYTLLAVCNGRYYGGGYLAGPQALLNDGVLDVLLVRKVNRAELITIIGDYKKGKHITGVQVTEKFRPYLKVFRAHSVRIDVLDDRPLVVTLDGECTPCRTSLEVKVCPGAVRALVPATAKAQANVLCAPHTPQTMMPSGV